MFIRILTLVSLLLSISPQLAGDDDSVGQQRERWTTSRVVGSPDPPLPYSLEPTFEKIRWRSPIYAKPEPGTNRLLVIQEGGPRDRPAQILAVDDNAAAETTEMFLEVPDRLVYGIEFHPQYQENGYVYIHSNGPHGRQDRQDRVSRYTVSRETRLCDPDTEVTLLEWDSRGHDGGDLAFGRDSMLYISTGDGTTDSDEWLSAQDISNLLGCVLRIDVDHPDDDRPYSIPSDNPFLHIENARGEIWAFGLRNPWRMSADALTGTIWIGSNGQDLWETVHIAQRGANYGWSVYEGNHPFYLNRQLGPAPFVPPTIEHHHREARSLTGGVTYYGERLPELQGVYVYGDYGTGKIWGARFDGQRITWKRELADTTLKIAGFSNTHTRAGSPGDLIVVDHGGGLYRMKKNDAPSHPAAFPRKLSQTGLFASTAEHDVAPGVIAYAVNTPAWNDAAEAERYLAVPGDATIRFARRRGWNCAEGTVLMQTLFSAPAQSSDRRRIETRLLLRQGADWSAYSYRWNAAQDDAELVDSDGAEATITIYDGADHRKVHWRFPSRAECMTCHSREVNFALGLSTLQMNRDHPVAEHSPNQIVRLAQIGILQAAPDDVDELDRLVNPHDSEKDISVRARSYLHANCSGCHVRAGGGNSRIALDFQQSLEETRLVNEFPQHATFNLVDARIVAPGESERSVLWQRIRRRGRGQMPPLVTTQVDERGVTLIGDWIKQMKPDRQFVRAWTVKDFDHELSENLSKRSIDAGRKAYRDVGCAQCHRAKDQGGGAGPKLDDIGKRMSLREIVASIVKPSEKIAPEFATTVIETVDGQLVEGRVERETADELVVRVANVLGKPARIPKTSIEGRSFSKTSSMPVGLLDTLERDQVLDLLAFLLSDD